MTQLAMLPSPTSVIPGCEARGYVYLLEQYSIIYFECHIVKSVNHILIIQMHTGCKNKEKFPSPHQLGIFIKINRRDCWRYSVRHSSIQVIQEQDEPKALSYRILYRNHPQDQ